MGKGESLIAAPSQAPLPENWEPEAGPTMNGTDYDDRMSPSSTQDCLDFASSLVVYHVTLDEDSPTL